MYVPSVAFQSELLDTGLRTYIYIHHLDACSKIKFVQFFILSTINSNYNIHSHNHIQITILKERNNTFKHCYSFIQNMSVCACFLKCISITCHSVILQLLCIRVQCNMRMISAFKSCIYWCWFSQCSKSHHKKSRNLQTRLMVQLLLRQYKYVLTWHLKHQASQDLCPLLARFKSPTLCKALSFNPQWGS